MEDDKIVMLLKNPESKNQGFKALMDKYQVKLYWHVRRIVLSHEDADDVLQNVFIKVFKYIDGFKGESKLYTWLYRIATNEAITNEKKNKKRWLGEIDDYVEQKLTSDPFFEGDQVQRELKKAVASLPEKQMMVFNMKYYQQMKYDDMSKVLDTSVGGLKASYHHAVKKITKIMQQESFLYE